MRGSFDPEVMSVVYLINSVGKPGAVRASLLAWIITFGRHLIPRAPREQPYSDQGAAEDQLTLTPMAGSESATGLCRQHVPVSGVEMMAHKALDFPDNETIRQGG